MSSPVVFVTPSEKIITIKHIYEKPNFHHHIPVVKEDRLVGMVSLVDFMRAIHNAGLDDDEQIYQTATVGDIMSLHPTTIQANETIRKAIEILAEGNFHALPVLDKGKICGMVTTKDILRFLLDEN